jgi:hypothetical protein
VSVTARELPPQFPVRDLSGLRASELSRCPRMAAYRKFETPEEPTDLERRYFARGRLYGEFVAKQLAERYGADNVVFEKPVRWAFGTAHPDIYVKSEKLIVEVKSTTAPPTSLLFDMAIWQTRIYMHLDPDAERGQVYVINPSSLVREDVIPVELHPEHADQIDQWLEAVAVAVRSQGAQMPERVCSKPSDGRSRLCPFIETCFAGWEPQLVKIDDEKLVELAAKHHALAEQERVSRRAADALKKERQQLEQELGALIDPGEYEADGYVVRRTHVGAREKFDIGRARKAGAWGAAHDEVFGPFVQLVGEHERFSVKRQDGDVLAPLASADDYGDVPF